MLLACCLLLCSQAIPRVFYFGVTVNKCSCTGRWVSWQFLCISSFFGFLLNSMNAWLLTQSDGHRSSSPLLATGLAAFEAKVCIRILVKSPSDHAFCHQCRSMTHHMLIIFVCLSNQICESCSQTWVLATLTAICCTFNYVNCNHTALQWHSPKTTFSIFVLWWIYEQPLVTISRLLTTFLIIFTAVYIIEYIGLQKTLSILHFCTRLTCLIFLFCYYSYCCPFRTVLHTPRECLGSCYLIEIFEFPFWKSSCSLDASLGILHNFSP